MQPRSSETMRQPSVKTRSIKKTSMHRRTRKTKTKINKRTSVDCGLPRSLWPPRRKLSGCPTPKREGHALMGIPPGPNSPGSDSGPSTNFSFAAEASTRPALVPQFHQLLGSQRSIKPVHGRLQSNASKKPCLSRRTTCAIISGATATKSSIFWTRSARGSVDLD